MFKNKKIILSSLALAALLIGGISYSYILSKQIQAIDEIKSRDIRVSGTAGAPAVFKVKPKQKVTRYQSDAFKADFKFNAIAPHWRQRLGSQAQIKFAIKVSDDDKSWSSWLPIDSGGPLRNDDPHPDRVYPETPVFLSGKYFKYRLSLVRPSSKTISPQIEDVKMNYIDSTDKTPVIIKKLSSLFRPVDAKSEGPGIVSRKAWGSPDPYGTKYKGTAKYWPARHYPVKQVFLHHTVNANLQSDPKAAVRAIWQYHTHTRGWGDIGYNYLVDQNGTTYEGRWGGDNVQGGHVYEFNAGSLGVAMIGCFDTSEATCSYLNNGDSPPSNKMIGGLSTLLAWKMKNFNIPLAGSHRFCGTKKCLRLPFITGHRSAYGTSCPGDLALDEFTQIRKDVKTKASKIKVAAQRLDFDTIRLGGPDEVTQVNLRFKNRGRYSWYNSGARRVRLVTTAPDNRSSIFRAPDWPTSRISANLVQNRVRPGQTGTFNLELDRPPSARGVFYENFKIHHAALGSFNNMYSLRLEADPYSELYNWRQVSLSAYTDDTKVTAVDLDNAPPATDLYIKLRLRNIGRASWDSEDPYPVRLATARPHNRLSELCHDSWLSCRRVADVTGSIGRSEINTFEFWITTPAVAGTYEENFNLIVTNLLWMPDNDLALPLRVVEPVL